MRSFPRPSVMAVVALAVLVLAAVPVGANGVGPTGCVNVKASLNGEGLFLWYGVMDAIGLAVGAGPDSAGGATFGVVVFPELCTADRAVDAALAGLQSEAQSTSAPADPTSQVPLLP